MVDWNKEFRVSNVFRRRPKSEEPSAEQEHETSEESSVWKKELRVSSMFRRGKQEDQPQLAPEEPQPVSEKPQPAEPVTRTEAPVADAEAAGAEVEAQLVPEPGEEPAPGEEQVAPIAEEHEPQPVSEEPQRVEPDAHVADREQPPADAEEPVADASEPEPEVVADLEAPGEASVWKKKISLAGMFRRSQKQEQPVPLAPEPQPDWVLEPLAFAESEPAGPVAGQPAGEIEDEVVGSEPLAAMAEEPEPQPGGVADPQTAVKRSVWKKDVALASMFRRGKKEKAEAGVSERSLTASSSESEARLEPTAEANSGLAREPELVTEAEAEPAAELPAEAAAAAAAVAATSRWKKEISIGRRRDRKEKKAGGRGKLDRRDEAPRRDRSTDDRAARSEARGPQIAGALPDVPLLRALNLLPREETRTRHGRPSLPQVGVALLGLLVLGGLSFVFVYERARVADRKSAVEDLQAQVVVIETPSEATEPEQGVALAGELLARAGSLSTALDGRIVWDRLLRQLSLVLPPDVWFETISSTSTANVPDPATGLTPPSSGASLTITGYAKTQEGLAQLVGRLAVLPQLASVQLQSGALIERGDEEVVQFTVAATLKAERGVVS